MTVRPSCLPLLLACHQGPTDRERYVAAARAPSDPAACRAIEATDLRLECLVLAARTLAQRGEARQAAEICAEVTPGTWRDECWFLLADATGATGEACEASCALAGRFASQCRSHCMTREAELVLARHPPGEEHAAFVALERALTTYGDQRTARARSTDILAQHIAARSPLGTFDVTTCGSAPEQVCREAVLAAMRLVVVAEGRPARSLRDHCAEGGDPGSLGLLAWGPAADEVVDAAWRTWCGR